MLVRSCTKLREDTPITNARGVFSDVLAEYCVAVALFFTKRMLKFRENQANRVWERFNVERLSGKTVGLLGYGSIGRQTAGLFRALGCKVVAADKEQKLSNMIGDPHATTVYDTSNKEELEQFISRCDFIVSSLPATAETYHFCSSGFFKTMKDSAVFISVGRGSTVDESALKRALLQGDIQGAALDVFETEPLPQDSELWGIKSCLISSHNAHYVANWLEESLDLFYTNYDNLTNNAPLVNLVDRRAGY